MLRKARRSFQPRLVVLVPLFVVTALMPVAVSPIPAAAGLFKQPRVVSTRYTYDLATASGEVLAFGGARSFGSAISYNLPAPIVGIASTSDLLGYWLVGADGSVYAFGDAVLHGSLAGKLTAPDHVIAILPTADDGGYWLVDANGVIRPFGDAHRIGPGRLPPADLSTPIVSAAVMRNGLGAWLTNAAGEVFTIGGAVSYGSLAGTTLASPVTGMAATPSGLGYWLTEANGSTYAFGNAVPSGTATKTIPGSVVGIVPAADRWGYWAVSDKGYVVAGGDARSRGGTTLKATGSPVVGIALAQKWVPSPVGGGFPSGSVGYDVNWPQCSGSQAGNLPGPPGDIAGSAAYSIAIVGVDGWAVGSDNPCLAAEIAWAKNATEPAGHSPGTPAYDLYIFLNSPASTSTIDQSGPAGTCSKLSGGAKDHCLAYNYGYNAAIDAISYASSQGASATRWWLDIENDACAPGIYNDISNGEYWSCNQELNSATIQAALDAVRSKGLTAGIYSTSIQYKGITGGYVPTGGSGPLPLWIAGANWTSPPYPSSTGYPAPSANAAYCAGGSLAFAGGQPVILQETPGPNGYPFDPDYAC